MGAHLRDTFDPENASNFPQNGGRSHCHGAKAERVKFREEVPRKRAFAYFATCLSPTACLPPAGPGTRTHAGKNTEFSTPDYAEWIIFFIDLFISKERRIFVGCQRAPVSGHAVVGTRGWSLLGAAAETQVVPQQRGGAGRVCASSARAGEAGAKPAGLLVGGTFTVQACPSRIPPQRTHPPPETQDKKQAER